MFLRLLHLQLVVNLLVNPSSFNLLCKPILELHQSPLFFNFQIVQLSIRSLLFPTWSFHQHFKLVLLCNMRVYKPRVGDIDVSIHELYLLRTRPGLDFREAWHAKTLFGDILPEIWVLSDLEMELDFFIFNVEWLNYSGLSLNHCDLTNVEHSKEKWEPVESFNILIIPDFNAIVRYEDFLIVEVSDVLAIRLLILPECGLVD